MHSFHNQTEHKLNNLHAYLLQSFDAKDDNKALSCNTKKDKFSLNLRTAG